MKKYASALAAVLLALSAVVAPTHAQRPADSAADVAQGVADGRASATELLIQFRPGVSADDQRNARGWVNAQRKELLRGRGTVELELAVIPPGLSMADAIAVLTQHPAVAFAEPNWIYTHHDTSNDPHFTDGSLWGMYGADTAPANAFGSGAATAWENVETGSSSVLVGVIDEGINYNHEDLAANIWTNPYEQVDGVDNDGNGYVDDVRGWDFANNDSSVYDGSSKRLSIDAHGTHVSGTIGAVGGNGIGVAGVNWNVRIISAKFLGTNGGTTANAIKAVDYLTDLKLLHDLNIVATNNSWGGGGYSQALHDAIIRGAKAGILFIAAAGNSTTNNDTTNSYPSNYNTTIGTGTESAAGFDAVIAVAALCGSSASSYCSGGAGTLASFSSYGATTVDLAAPGVSVYSTTPGNRYSSYNGTSMATPHVTGAAALYASMYADSNAGEIKQAILGSTAPTASLVGKTATGGRLNIAGWFGSIGGPAPDAPTSLSVLSVSGADVSLDWDAAADADSSTTFNVLRKLNGGSYSTIASGVSDTDYLDTVPASGTYCYVVQAMKGGSSSGNSNEACAGVTVPVTPAPAAPTNLVAQAMTAKKQIGLSWTGSAGAAGYRIYRKTATTSFAYIGSASGTSAVNSGLNSGVMYTYYVTAMGTAESGPSNESSATAR